MAARNRSMNVQIATGWYEKGQQELKNHAVPDAINSFRKAATNDHDNSQYVLALATSLASAGRSDEARQTLMQLRVASPESGEINLELARLSAKDGSTPEAIRYYHNALYGVWPSNELVAQRRSIRAELIRFLLMSSDSKRALSELLILSSDIPDTEQAHNEVGQMFFAAGDWRRASEQFLATLRLNAENADALDGAGRSAFNVGDYKKASDYLGAAISYGKKDVETSDRLETARLVLMGDPLAPRLSSDERVRRLLTDLDSASEALQACASDAQGDADRSALHDVLMELAEGKNSRYRPADLKRDADEFRAALTLIYRIELMAEHICHESSARHRAFLLIAQRNGLAEQ